MSEPFAAEVDYANNHVCLKVRDLDSALGFYRDLLGLPVLRTLGPTDEPRFVWLPGLQLARQTEDPGPNPYGVFDHVGIAVQNLDAIRERLDAAGCPIERPYNRLHFPEIGRDVVTIFYRDPDGNLVELLQWL